MSGTPNTTDFAFTGTIATFVVPVTGEYELSAAGAQASDVGGEGGFAGGEFYLVQGDTLLIAVG